MNNYLKALGACVLVAACDGGSGSGSGGQFGPAVNQSPTLGSVLDQLIPSNTSTDVLAISVSDDTTAATELQLSATADNADLLDADSLVLGGDGESRTLVLTPKVDAIGESIVTLVLTDADGATTSTQFTLTVEQGSVSFSNFMRTVFEDPADGEPRSLAGIHFLQDGADDDFADLCE